MNVHHGLLKLTPDSVIKGNIPLEEGRVTHV